MTDPTRQEFLTDDNVRLLVERNATTGAGASTELVNRLANTNGKDGGYGWSTPVTGTKVGRANLTPDVLEFRNIDAATAPLLSTPIPMQAAHYIAAQWTEVPGDNGHRARFAFFSSDGVQISATTASGFYRAASDTVRSYAAVQAPAGTAYARFRIDMYNSNANDAPAHGTMIRFTDAIVATASDTAHLANIATAQQAYYTDVLPVTQAIRTTRSALNLGTLTARIISTSLDPASNNTLRPGRRIRLEAFANGVWEPVFVGRTGKPQVEYVTAGNNVWYPVIDVVAYDAVAVLAGTPAPTGYTLNTGLSSPLERTVVPVPWLLNGISDQAPGGGTGDATDPAAKLLDQVIRTRDTNYGAAWVSRRGVVTVVNPLNMSSTNRDTWTDEDYEQDLKIAWDIDRAVNTVTVTDLDGTTSTTTGPIQQPASVETWGELPATFTTIKGPSDFATVVLQGNGTTITGAATPVLMVEQATFVLSTTARIDRYLTRELWDLVTVQCPAPAIDAQYRIRAISHQLTAGGSKGDRWAMTVEFAIPNRVAMPTT